MKSEKKRINILLHFKSFHNLGILKSFNRARDALLNRLLSSFKAQKTAKIFSSFRTSDGRPKTVDFLFFSPQGTG